MYLLHVMYSFCYVICLYMCTIRNILLNGHDIIFQFFFLLDPLAKSVQQAIEAVADAVTHARFVGTDPSSDEVVLMKILHVSKRIVFK